MNNKDKPITINSGISQSSQIYDKSKANSGILNPYEPKSIISSNLKESDLSKSNLKQSNTLDPTFRIKEEGGNSNITCENLSSNVQTHSQLTNNHEEFNNNFMKLESSFLRDSNISNQDKNFPEYSFGQGSLVRDSNLRDSNMRGNSWLSQGDKFGRQSGGFFQLNASDLKKPVEFSLQNSNISQQDLRMSIQNEDNQSNKFSSDMLRPSSEIRMPSDFKNFPSNLSGTSQLGQKDIFRNSVDLSQTKMPTENTKFQTVNNNNDQKDQMEQQNNEDLLSKPLIRDSGINYRISEESSWREQSNNHTNMQGGSVRMSTEDGRISQNFQNPYRGSDNIQGFGNVQGLGQQLDGVDLYRDSKNSYRNSDMNRPFSGDITHFQNQKIEEGQDGVRQSGSVFGGDYRQSDKYRHSNKSNFMNEKFQQPINRESIQSRGSRGPNYVNFDNDNRNSLEQDYETAKQFGLGQNRFSMGQRLSTQNDGNQQFMDSQNQQMLTGNNQSRNISERFSNTSQFNRPSVNNRVSNVSNQRMSFPSFDFEAGQNPSTRNSQSNRGSNMSSILEEKSEKAQIQGCTCTRSRCLKQYCQCFQNQRFCGPSCRCIDCHNNPQNEQHIIHARQQILNRNPEAFSKKLDLADTNNSGGQNSKNLFSQTQQNNIFNNPNLKQIQQLQSSVSQTASSMANSTANDGGQNPVLIYKKGCNCRKTHCLKKYCECYNAGVKCHSLCKCDNCHNQEEDGMETEDQPARQQSLSQIEMEFCRQKKFQSLSIEQQQQLLQKQQQVNIVGRGID